MLRNILGKFEQAVENIAGSEFIKLGDPEQLPILPVV
jgi:hypothetical protein